MWSFIKSIVGVAVDLIAGPFINLKNFTKETLAQKVWSVMDCLSRVFIIASLFVSVPAFLVSLSWAWIWLNVIIGVLAVIAGLSVIGAGIAFAMKAEQEPEAA